MNGEEVIETKMEKIEKIDLETMQIKSFKKGFEACMESVKDKGYRNLYLDLYMENMKLENSLIDKS